MIDNNRTTTVTTVTTVTTNTTVTTVMPSAESLPVLETIDVANGFIYANVTIHNYIELDNSSESSSRNIIIKEDKIIVYIKDVS